jgi:hypothetical protein
MVFLGHRGSVELVDVGVPARHDRYELAFGLSVLPAAGLLPGFFAVGGGDQVLVGGVAREVAEHV